MLSNIATFEPGGECRSAEWLMKMDLTTKLMTGYGFSFLCANTHYRLDSGVFASS